MNISRRDLLVQGAAFTSAALIAGDALQLNADPLGQPIGLQLYTVGAELKTDFDGTLKKVAAVGYREVEGAGFPGKTPADVKKSFAAAGLHCKSVHISIPGGIQEAAGYANALGAKYVISSVLLPRPLPPGKMDMAGFMAAISELTLDDYKIIADQCNKLGEEAKKAGLQFGYHNHNFEFKPTAGGIGYDVLLKSTDPSLVKFELDCGWMKAAGHDPAEYLMKYPDRYRLLHIKDFKPLAKPTTGLAESERPAPAELGRGSIDYKPIFAAARKTQVEQYYVEQEPPYTDMPALEAIKVNYDYLHNFAG